MAVQSTEAQAPCHEPTEIRHKSDEFTAVQKDKILIFAH